MIKEIVKDHFLLSLKGQDANKEDAYIIQDLKDTLAFHHEHCVGMAANMIGYNKRILIFDDRKAYTIMVNPVVLKYSDTYYMSKEGCLSHSGQKEVKRYHKIKVQYLDEHFKLKIKTYEGFVAQIIQHEMDHFEGILI